LQKATAVLRCSWLSLRETPMSKNDSLRPSPQLVFVEQSRAAVALTFKQIQSLQKKANDSGYDFNVILEVYRRGLEQDGLEKTAFGRVNSFIAEGKAYEMDRDLVEKRGLWDNIHAKRERIKRGSGEHMRKPGSKGAPTDQDFKNSQSEAYTNGEPQSSDPKDASSRFIGSDSLTNVYRNSTPGQSLSKTAKIVKKVIKEQRVCEDCDCHLKEDKKGYKSESGGLTQKGRDHYNRESGGHLKAPVTTEPSKLKKGSKAANRRKSFCARMGGMKKKLTGSEASHDPDSRINKALRKWNC